VALKIVRAHISGKNPSFGGISSEISEDGIIIIIII
jgi:hypothetical protein